MAAPREEIIEQALTLRKEDRAEIAGALIRSLESAPEPGVDEAWRDEVERRARELDTGAVKALPWESVRGRFMRPLRG